MSNLSVHTWETQNMVRSMLQWKVDASAAGVSVLAFRVTTIVQKQQELWTPWSSTVTYDLHRLTNPRILERFDHNPSRKPLASAAGAAGAAASVACTKQKGAWNGSSINQSAQKKDATSFKPRYQSSSIRNLKWCPGVIALLLHNNSKAFPKQIGNLEVVSVHEILKDPKRILSASGCLRGWSLLHGFSLGLATQDQKRWQITWYMSSCYRNASHCVSHRLLCWRSWCLSCLPQHVSHMFKIHQNSF